MPLPGRLGTSFRFKLLATYLALAAVIGASVLYAVDRRLGDDLESALDDRLQAQARAVAGWLTRSGNPQRLAKRLARVVDARVSVIDKEGRIVGDSLLRTGVPGDDPEGPSIAVEHARQGRVGRQSRFSTAAGHETYFVAVPTRGGGAIRLAVPTADMDATRRGLRLQLALIALFGFLGAVAIGILATRTLVRERDLLSSVMGSLVEGVAVIDAKGAVILDNKSARGVLKTTADQTVADDKLRALVETSTAKRVVSEAELVLSGRTLLASAQPLRHGTGSVVVVLYDVTSLRRLENLRRDFVANLTHELRTPVTAIRGYAETLVSTPVDDDTRGEFLNTLQRNAVRIGRLVDDLLILSKLDGGPRDDSPAAEVSLAKICGQVAQTVQPSLDSAEVKMTVEVSEDLQVYGDAVKLEQVVQNLVDNAIKYGGSGGHVSVAASRKEDTVEIMVTDKGSGIPEQHHARLFERFYRVDPGRSREQGGTGLGLAIVKHLTESMGGQVAIDGAYANGCRFTVTLRAVSPSSPKDTSA